MRSTLILVALPLAAMAGDPEPLVRLGSDRFRQAEQVMAIAYSQDGKHLATADAQNVYVWDAAGGRLLRTIPGKEKRTGVTLKFSPGGRTLYAVIRTERNGFILRQIDPTAGKVIASDVVVPDRERALLGPDARFSPDGAYLAVSSDERTRLRLFDTAARKELWVQSRNEDAQVWSFRFRPDGRALAVGSAAGPVEVLDVPTGKVLHLCAVNGRVVLDLALSPDGKELVVLLFDPQQIAGIEIATGTERWTTPVGNAGLPAFTADGKSVRYWGQGKDRSDSYKWRWLDAVTGNLQSTLDLGIGNEDAFRADDKIMALGGLWGHISQWDLSTRRRLAEKSADPGLPVTELSFTGDGTKLRGWANGWYEWDATTGKQVRLSPAFDIGPSERAVGSPDSKWLVRGSAVSVLVEIESRKKRAIGFPDTQYQFLPNGRLIASKSGRLRVYDPPAGQFSKPLFEIAVQHGAVAGSADGTIAVGVVPTGDHFHSTRYDLTTGKATGESDGRLPDSSLMDRSHDWRAALAPDGRVLAVHFTYLAHPGMGFDRIEELHTALFDARTGRYLSGWWDLHAQADLAFSPDGRMVACYYPSGLGVDIREVATGERRTRRPCPPIHSAAFSPDGRWLALATGPTPVALWDLIGKPAGKWADQKPTNLWDGLASEEAELAFDVIRTLRQHPAEAVAFLKQRFKVATAPAAEWVAGRIKALDAPQFRDREQATTDLAGAGELIVPELRAALRTASPEARRRLEGLLEKANTPSRETWRAIRACEALEGIGTPAARELLAVWAKGPPAATLMREAAESAERLARRR